MDDPSIQNLAKKQSFDKWSGKILPREFRVDLQLKQLLWVSDKKKGQEAFIDISTITSIIEGQESKGFKGAPKGRASASFSVIHGTKFKSIDLMAPSDEIAKAWVAGLRAFVDNSEGMSLDDYLRKLWKATDKDKSGTLDVDEIYKLLYRLNANQKKSEIKEALKKITDGKKFVEFDDFKKYYKQLKDRVEVDPLFKEAAGEGATVVSKDKLKAWVSSVQKQDLTDEELDIVMTKCGNDDESKDGLSKFGFSQFLESKLCNLVDPKKNTIYQDMTQPMAHYWVNSSHNTYLMEDQLKGPSSVEAYRRALEKGCRCVELDCWDGPDGQPIVFHGHTLTSKIKFRDIIDTVAKFAFTASNYPVLLSLENHCGVEQQTRMAEIMLEILKKDTDGGLLYTEPLEAGPGKNAMPSPEHLKGKVFLKGKALPPGADDQAELSDDSSDDDDDAEELAKMKKEQGKKKGEKHKISTELSKLIVLCKTAKFKSLEDSVANGDAAYMSSFVEGKSEKFAKEFPEDYVKYNQRQFSRIYPGGGRVDSSNYDPALSWAKGAQIVALNFQTYCEHMRKNLGKYEENGNAGYILKPQSLLGGPAPPAQKVKITVMSAFNLPKPGSDKDSEVIDPYVSVELWGTSNYEKLKTKKIEDNGFNPVWTKDNSKVFDVPNPDTAFFTFTVWDDDTGKDDYICEGTAAGYNIRPGFRNISMRDKKWIPLPHSSVFVHIEFV